MNAAGLAKGDYRDLAEAGCKSQDSWVSQKRHQRRPLFKGKAKYGGIAVSGDHRKKALKDRNTKLKTLLAEAMPDNATLRNLAARTW